MVFTDYAKKRILQYSKQGYSSRRMVALLKEEGICASHCGIAKFISLVETTGSIARLPGRGRPPKVTEAMKT